MRQFSKTYYVRYHIWQNLVAAVGDNMPDPKVMSEMAQAGLDFIWGNGEDIWEEEKEERETAEAYGGNVLDFGGPYL